MCVWYGFLLNLQIKYYHIQNKVSSTYEGWGFLGLKGNQIFLQHRIADSIAVSMQQGRFFIVQSPQMNRLSNLVFADTGRIKLFL